MMSAQGRHRGRRRGILRSMARAVVAGWDRYWNEVPAHG